MKASMAPASARPTATEAQVQKALYCRARSRSPWPRAMAMAVQAPDPNRVPMPWKMLKAGPHREMAATCMVSPVWPIKNTSAML